MSGVILFTYVAFHLVNHALGLISIAAAERGLHVAVAVWQSVPGTIVLYGAAAVHIALAFVAVYERRTLRMPPLELLRIVLGFTMPTLLIGHAVATRLAYTIYGHPPDYAHVVWALWHSGRQGLQIALLVPGWVHGCLGLNFAFRARQWFARVRLVLFGAALLLPVLAVLGFLSMLKEVTELANDPGWAATIDSATTAAQRATLTMLRGRMLDAYLAALVLLLAARWLRSFVEVRRGSLVAIAYPDRTIRVPRGWSILEASRSHRIAHVSICGGRGRCSTCRVRIVDGDAHCPPPSPAESKTLARVRASPDTRLACQLRPSGDVGVVPLLSAPRRGSAATEHGSFERELVAMQVAATWDGTYDRLLPHDRLYATQRFHETVEAVAGRFGGVATESVGDRAVMLFGLDEPTGEAARRALASARRLVVDLDRMNDALSDAIGCRAAHAIHLHGGTVAVADRAPGHVPRAVGDPIDTLRALSYRQAPRDGPSAVTLFASQVLLRMAGETVPDAAEPIEAPGGSRVAFVRLTTATPSRGPVEAVST